MTQLRTRSHSTESWHSPLILQNPTKLQIYLPLLSGRVKYFFFKCYWFEKEILLTCLNLILDWRTAIPSRKEIFYAIHSWRGHSACSRLLLFAKSKLGWNTNLFFFFFSFWCTAKNTGTLYQPVSCLFYVTTCEKHNDRKGWQLNFAQGAKRDLSMRCT